MAIITSIFIAIIAIMEIIFWGKKLLALKKYNSHNSPKTNNANNNVIIAIIAIIAAENNK